MEAVTTALAIKPTGSRVRAIHAPTSALALAIAACAPGAASVSTGPSPAWDFRIVIPDTREETTLPRMIERLARADVVLFGEQHDDPDTHRAEAALLEAIGWTGRPVVLSLEMFARDAQLVLDDYLAGRVSEADFLARSHPWPRYATDYRPLVELAKARGWPVVAANVPRPLAAVVGQKGLTALDTLTPAERLHAARGWECPNDDYYARFLEEMRTHSAGSGAAPQAADTLPRVVAERFYLAQCLKDATMAESIVAALRNAPSNAILVHFNGAFHSDYAQGAVERVRRREPRRRLVVITAVPVRDPAMAPVAPQSGRAHFVIFTRRPRSGAGDTQ